MDREVALVAVILGIAVVPLLALLKLVPSRALRVAGAAGWLALALLVTAAAKGYRDPRDAATRAPVLTRPIERPQDDYVSSKRCRACHADQYASWYASFHRRMTQAVTPQTLQAPLAGQSLTWRGRTFDFTRQDDDFFVTMEDPDVKAGEPVRVTRRIALTTGSHHYEAYWYESGTTRKVSFLPFCWRVEAQRFMPVDAAFLVPPTEEQGSEGRWNLACNKCHTVHTEPRIEGQFQMDTTSAEFGIACEACHGPGRRHVEKNGDPATRYAAHFRADGAPGDDTIVDPSDLPPVRDAMVCGQCHAAVLDKDEATMREWLRSGFSYRPGDDLAKTRLFREVGAEKFWSDGMIRTSGREYNALLHTPCYTHQDEARGIMTCLSCHEMHPKAGELRSVEDGDWAIDQLKPGMRGDLACTQCHADFRDAAKVAAHSHHAAESEGSRCMNCHMPLTTYGLLKTERSHTVTSPTIAESVDVGRPNACNLCHLDRTLQWAGDALEEWYHAPSTRTLRGGRGLTQDERSIAAGVLWLTRGDAGQRAITVCALEGEAAQAAAGTGWQAPYLAELLADPYHAVRYLAERALRQLPDFAAFDYDYTSDPATLAQAKARARDLWTRTTPPDRRPKRDELLIDAQGRLDDERLRRLIGQRDDKRVVLAE